MRPQLSMLLVAVALPLSLGAAFSARQGGYTCTSTFSSPCGNTNITDADCATACPTCTTSVEAGAQPNCQALSKGTICAPIDVLLGDPDCSCDAGAVAEICAVRGGCVCS